MRRWRSIAILGLALIALYFVDDYLDLDIFRRPPTPGLSLQIQAAEDPDAPAGSALVTAVIQNNRSEAVTLVAPGDGSLVGRRTPVIRWSVTRVGEFLPQRRHPLRDLSGGCGNMNPVTADDVFTLAPGESKHLDLWSAVGLTEPGTYRVVFHYDNRPEMPSREGLDGPIDPAVARSVRGSLPCTLRSNELVITIPPR
jgi:hypothetical protein